MFCDVPDKYQKYLTLLGGVFIHVSLASSHTFGNMNPYMISYLRVSTHENVRYSAGVWYSTLLGVAQVISIFLFTKIGYHLKLSSKTLVFFGCVLISASHALTYFTIKSSFALSLVTFGVMNGLGNGLSYVLTLGIAMKWFSESKGFANSAILFGSGLGGIIFNQIETLYINPKNLKPDLPYSDKFPDEKYFSEPEILKRIPISFLILAIIFFSMELIGLFLIKEVKPDQQQEVNKDDEENIQSTDHVINESNQDANEESSLIDTKNNKYNSDVNSLGVKFNVPFEGMSVREVIKQPSFYLISAYLNLTIIPIDIFSVNYKSYGFRFINDDQFLATVGSVSNIFNVVGRIAWGLIADRLPLKICLLTINTSIMVLLFTVIIAEYLKSKFLYMLYVGTFLFLQAGFYVIAPTLLAKCFGQKYFEKIYATNLSFGIALSFITPVISSLSESIGWFGLFLVCNGFGFAAWISIAFLNVKNMTTGDDI